MSDYLTCVQCGATNENVKRYSPDMDIEPVALCTICWVEMVAPAAIDPKEET